MKMKMAPTLENYLRHVAELSEAFQMCVLFDDTKPRHHARALLLDGKHLSSFDRELGLREQVVLAPPITDDCAYAVVMHEMGHHLAPNGLCRTPVPKPGCHRRDWFEFFAAKLVSEEAAWEWARYYIEQRFDWTIGMEATKQYALATYLQARRTGR
jgi:hypothetical protein